MRQNDPYRSTNHSSHTIGKGRFPIKPSNIKGNLQCCNGVSAGLMARSFKAVGIERGTSRELDLAACAEHAVKIRMENETQNFPQAEISDASQIYHAPVLSQFVPSVFDVAIRALVPSGKHNEICALFAQRVSYSSIKFWRYGKRPPPQWARDMLHAHLSKRRLAYDVLLTRLAHMPLAPGQGSGREITQWNARRAALIAEKKKGAD